MKIFNTYFLVSFACLVFSFATNAQTVDTRWGKIADDEWNMTRCEFDTAATAVVLLDVGRIFFLGGQAVIERHKRIKILDPQGIDYANVEVPFVHFDQRESISEVKAQTWNRTASGKAEKQELSNSQEMIDKSDEYWSRLKLAFPSVKVGTILEYRYKFYTSNLLFLEPWFFQNDIPTVHSEVRAEVPPYLTYNLLKMGYRLRTRYTKNEEARWVLNQIPGYKNEKFVHNPKDYAEQIHFQLTSYQRQNTKNTAGGVETVNVLESWDALGTEELKGCNSYLNRDKAGKDLLANITTEGDAPKEQLRKIFNYVHENIGWNDFWSRRPSQTFKELIANKKGSTAEINLLLTSLLQAAGFEADPVLISTRFHGRVVQSFPLLSQFNNLICRVIVNGETYFLDAALRSHKHPYFLLPKEDLNTHGYLLKKDDFKWVTIAPYNSSRAATTLKLDFVNKTGELKLKYEGYNASDQRLPLFKNKEKYTPFEKTPEVGEQLIKLEAPEINNLEQVEAPLEITYKFPLDSLTEDLIYFSAINWTNFSEMPFKSPTRYFPIEMDYPFIDNLFITIVLPNNYKIEDLPSPVNIQLNSGKEAGRFTFNASVVSEHQFIITSKIQVKEMLLQANFYESVKKFYEMIQSKFSEGIVFKKQ